MRLESAQFEALFAGLDWRRVRPLEVAAPSAAEWLTGPLAGVILPLFCYGVGHNPT